MADKQQNRVQTAIPEVNVTIERPPYNPGPSENKLLPNAGEWHHIVRARHAS